MVRSKGILAVDGSENKVVFQGVHEQVDFHPSENIWAEGEDRTNKIVFIGRYFKDTQPNIYMLNVSNH